MSHEYSPERLARKWTGQLDTLLRETRALWDAGRSRKKPLLSFRLPEADSNDDQQAPRADREKLLYQGQVVWSVIARAFFPAYVPGRNTHYGSVVYGLNPEDAGTVSSFEDSVFDLAWQVNELRREGAPPAPPGAERVAAAISDDRSSFARIRLPESIGAHGESYFANLCVHRTRLPTGYLHERLLPLLIAPGVTEWCCILPLRFWAPRLREIWASGPPISPPERYAAMLAHYNIKP
jgi:hypothetical protein